MTAHPPYSREVLPARIAAPAFPPIGRGGTNPERAGVCAHCLPVELPGGGKPRRPVLLPLFGGPSTRVLFGKGVARAERPERRMDHLSAAHERCSDGRKVPTAAIREGVTKCPALSPFGMVPDHVAKIGACEHATRPAARSGLVARLSVRVLAGASCPGSFLGAA